MASALYEISPEGQLCFNFHEGQVRAWECARRFVAVLAGTQGGKTSWGPWWLAREIEARGPGDYLAVTTNYDLFKLKMLPSLVECFVNVLKIGRYWSGDRVIEIKDPSGNFLASKADDPMWARIILRSAEAGSGLECATAKAAWLDEAGQDEWVRDIWEAVFSRLSLALGRLLVTTTLYNWGYLKTDFYDRWAKGDPDYAVVNFDSCVNPAFPKVEWDRALASMPLWRFRMRYQGLYERPAGQIYDSFDERECKRPRWAIPPDWKRYLGLDFGGVNTAGNFYAQEPNTRNKWLYRLYKAGGRTAKEHVVEILRGEPMIPLCVGGSRSEGQWRQEFAAAGLPVLEPDVTEVDVGISRVYGAHKHNEILVFDDLDEYLQQKRAYSRQLDSDGQPTEKIQNKEIYHFMDAERYIIGWMYQQPYATLTEAVPIAGHQQTLFGMPVVQTEQPRQTTTDVAAHERQMRGGLLSGADLFGGSVRRT
jgi:hypothetical protein